ncbi:hypothetical protein ABK040_016021 [Willaertia magna]
MLSNLNRGKQELFTDEFLKHLALVEKEKNRVKAVDFLQKFGYVAQQYDIVCCKAGLVASFFTEVTVNMKLQSRKLHIVYKEATALEDVLGRMGLTPPAGDVVDFLKNVRESSSYMGVTEHNFTCVTKDGTVKTFNAAKDVLDYCEEHKDVDVIIGKPVPESKFRYELLNAESLSLTKQFQDKNGTKGERKETYVSSNLGKIVGSAVGALMGGAAASLATGRYCGRKIVLVVAFVVGAVAGGVAGFKSGEHCFCEKYCHLQITVREVKYFERLTEHSPSGNFIPPSN